MSLRIGISTNSIDPAPAILDGIGHYTSQLLQHLKGGGINTQGFAFPPRKGTIRLQYSEPFKHSYPRLALTGLLTKGLCAEPSVDIFHSTDFRIVPMKCPVVATLWDAIPFVHPEWVVRSFRMKVQHHLIQRSARFANHIITASYHAANDIIRYFKVDEKLITVIPCGIDESWYLPVEDILAKYVLKKLGLEPQGYFLSVGTFQPRKNFDRLIDAYVALPLSLRQDKKLVLVGKYGWGCERLVEKIHSLKQENQIIWLSNVSSDEELRIIYSQASVFVFPSLYEGFGLPLVEAFASGVPVVSSNATSLPEISQNAALEVNPYSTEELSEAMRLLATNSAEREKRIKLGLLRAQNYQWKHVLPQLLELYKKVIATASSK